MSTDDESEILSEEKKSEINKKTGKNDPVKKN